MKMHLQASSIPLMIGYLSAVRQGESTEGLLESIFQHPDVQFELRRYQPDIENIYQYFANIQSIEEDTIPHFSDDRPWALKSRHPLWVNAMENTQALLIQYQQMLDTFTPVLHTWIENRLEASLPAGMPLKDANVISTLGIGPSFGYVFEGALHFDFLTLCHEGSFASLPTLLTHELYHLAMWDFVSPLMQHFTLEERYIFASSGEGLAIKFCNNARGALSQAIYDDQPVNDGLDPFSMRYLNDSFATSFALFADTLQRIRDGSFSEEDFTKQMESYWWYPYLDDQCPTDIPKLQQSPIYAFGNDLYGTIYDAFGKDVLFDCLRHPLLALDRFAQAASERGFDQTGLLRYSG